jgi:steroid delta-isomerase-like uncharacterized protein
VTPDENKDVARRYYEEVWNQNDLTVLPELVAPGIVLNGWAPGLDGLKGVFASTRVSFPDLQYTVEDVMAAEDDKVVVRFTFRGTQLGEYRGVQPTGRAISYTGIGIWRLEDGKLAEHWSNVDIFGLMQQLEAPAA